MKTIVNWLGLLGSLLAAASLAACAAAAQPSNSEGQLAERTAVADVNATGRLAFQFHSDRFELDSPDKMCKALLVVSGTVKGYSPSRWNTPTGARPSGLDNGTIIRQGYRIFTPFTVGQSENLRDRRTVTGAAEYQVVGGTVGSDSWKDDAYPRPVVGQPAVMVFVPAIDGVTGQLNQGTPVLFEAFRIDQQGNVLLKTRTVEQGTVTQEEVKIALGSLRNYLAACS